MTTPTPISSQMREFEITNFLTKYHAQNPLSGTKISTTLYLEYLKYLIADNLTDNVSEKTFASIVTKQVTMSLYDLYTIQSLPSRQGKVLMNI